MSQGQPVAANAKLRELAGSGKSFSLSRSIDVMHKLDWEIRLVASTSPPAWIERAYATLNAAATAWHMKDWVFAELQANRRPMALARERLRAELTGVNRFGDLVANAEPAIHICSQLAWASKHALVTKAADVDVRTAHVQVPVAGRTGTYRSDIEILYKGAPWAPIQLLRQAQVFWSDFLVAVELGPEHDPEPMAGVIENVAHQLFDERAARLRVARDGEDKT